MGKALALEHGLPIVAVPTTYAASEMTPMCGPDRGSRKRTGRDPPVLPVSVLYGPELTTGLPIGMSVTSGLNAVESREGAARHRRCAQPHPHRGRAHRPLPTCLPERVRTVTRRNDHRVPAGLDNRVRRSSRRTPAIRPQHNDQRSHRRITVKLQVCGRQ
ncbi:iron-containing alcohol dehydrogenase [Streptomyces sp. RB17]|uniref:iron-containing alcohol dehydrogenase n=1 Tax=Streptomyces sp. RB17 TaxID=2585197 RepID=UPI001E2C3F3A|nr:iron-containing alcohol dehydrogenase [Streptomyces sp. RB17]